MNSECINLLDEEQNVVFNVTDCVFMTERVGPV